MEKCLERAFVEILVERQNDHISTVRDHLLKELDHTLYTSLAQKSMLLGAAADLIFYNIAGRSLHFPIDSLTQGRKERGDGLRGIIGETWESLRDHRSL